MNGSVPVRCFDSALLRPILQRDRGRSKCPWMYRRLPCGATGYQVVETDITMKYLRDLNITNWNLESSYEPSQHGADCECLQLNVSRKERDR